MPRSILVLLTAAAVLLAGNMWENHGVNFSYVQTGTGETITMFPVIWDVRGASILYWYCCAVYGIDTSENPILDLLGESTKYGFNATMVRTELQQEEVPGPYISTDYDFEVLANAVRQLGLDVIVGGFLTDVTAVEHNDATLDYLADYVELTVGQYPGEVIGVFGFDEPAVKFLENPENPWEWVSMVARYRDLCHDEIGLPMLSFISKFGTLEASTIMHYYNDTTSVLNRFARHLDIVALNMYPIKNNDRRLAFIPFDMENVLFCGTTDLIPSDSPYYEAYCDRDEFFTVTEEGGQCTFTVYEFLCTPNFDDLYIEEAFAMDLPFRPTDMACSDFRSCDIGRRSFGEHRLNGAVVLWDSTAMAGEEIVMIHDGRGIVSARLPDFPGSDRAVPVAFCVGQNGQDLTDPIPTGILGRWDTAIMGCYELGGTDTRLVVFGREGDDSFILETDEPFPLRALDPDGIIWGRFWGDGLPEAAGFWLENGAFLLYDNAGSYVIIVPRFGRWSFFPTETPPFRGLFGPMENPSSVFISHESGSEPSFTPGNDFVTAYFDQTEPILTRSRSTGIYTPLDSVLVSRLSGQGGEVEWICSFRPDKHYGDVLITVGVDGSMERSTGTISGGESGGFINMQSLTSVTGGQLLPGARVMHTRKNIRAGVVLSDNALILPASELIWTEFDHLRLEWFSECYEVCMDNAIFTTDNDNCAFANVQSYGRHAFGLPSYYASRDTLLYMATVPIIKGCRGLVFYAMDIALMSGNRTSEGELRYPDLLQNWGPSRDVGNVFVPERVNQVVAALTGNGPEGGPHFLDALVDSSYRVLQTTEAVNCLIGGAEGTYPDPADTTLNFLAVENIEDGTILMLVSNETGSQLESGRGICFPGRFNGNYTLNVVDGFAPQRTYSTEHIFSHETGTVGYGTLVLDFSGMPSTTVSLLEIVSGTPNPGSSAFLQVYNYMGSSWVRFRAVPGSMGELALYDLAGRKTRTLWSGVGGVDVLELTVERESLPVGMYFVTLTSGGYFFPQKILLLR